MRTWICFPAGRDIAVANDMISFNSWIQGLDGTGGGSQHPVLNIGKILFIAALQLDTNGKIIASFLVLEAGSSRMPGSLFQRYKLYHCAIASDQHVGRDLQLGNFLKIRVLLGVQFIQEQILNPGAAEFARRQTDIVDDQQSYFSIAWTLVTVWRRAWYSLLQPLICNSIWHNRTVYSGSDNNKIRFCFMLHHLTLIDTVCIRIARAIVAGFAYDFPSQLERIEGFKLSVTC